MRKFIHLLLVLVCALSLVGCERRNAAQNEALEQTQIAATVQAMSGGIIAPPPASGSAPEPVSGGGEPPVGQPPAEPPPSGGGQPPVVQPPSGGAAPSGPAQISFLVNGVNTTIIELGVCVTEAWTVTNAQQVFYENSEVAAQSSVKFCPNAAAVYTHHLRVIQLDGSEQEATVMIKVNSPGVNPVVDQADLVVSKVELGNPAPSVNQAFKVKVTIENRGPAAARNFQWGVIPTYSSAGPNNPLGGETIAVLNAGTAKVYAVDVIYPSSGTFTLRAVADLNNVVNDPDRANNNRDKGVGVSSQPLKPRADLQVTNVNFSKMNPSVNEEITISATVYNAGPDQAKDLTWGIYYAYSPGASNQLVKNGVIPLLNANDDVFVSAKVSYGQGGAYTVRVVPDTQAVADDPAPGNSHLEKQIQVGALSVPPPTNCRGVVVNSTKIVVSWTSTASGGVVDGYKVYESHFGGAPKVVAANVNTVSMSGLTPNTQYWFYVTAYKGMVESQHNACGVAISTPP